MVGRFLSISCHMGQDLLVKNCWIKSLIYESYILVTYDPAKYWCTEAYFSLFFFFRPLHSQHCILQGAGTEWWELIATLEILKFEDVGAWEQT